MDYFAQTDLGRKRTNNEDCYYARTIRKDDGEEIGIMIVADGVGGAEKGEYASCLTSKIVGDYLYDQLKGGAIPPPPVKEIFQKAIEMANARVREEFRYTPEKGMATTLVAALVHNRELLIANVGDSRAYYLFGTKMRQITKDHSLVQEFVDAGKLSYEEAQRHPQKNIITRAIGTADNVQIDFFSYELPGDDPLFLLCTDGLHGMIDLTNIYTPESKKIPLNDLSQILINRANEAGGLDNITLIVARPLHKSEIESYPPVMPRELEKPTGIPPPPQIVLEKPIAAKPKKPSRAITIASPAIAIMLIAAVMISAIVIFKPATNSTMNEPLIGLSDALNRTMTHLNLTLNRTDYVGMPVMTDNFTGYQCSWKGPHAGNCSKWTFHFEGIKRSKSRYIQETINISIYYRNRSIQFEKISLSSPEFNDDSLSEKTTDIENRSLDGYHINDSREIFLILNKEISKTSQNRTISMDMTFDIMTPKYYGNPVWVIDWIYQNQNELNKKETFFIIDGMNGVVLETKPQ